MMPKIITILFLKVKTDVKNYREIRDNVEFNLRVNYLAITGQDKKK